MTETTPAEELTISLPHRELLDQVLDKWSLEVLNQLCVRPCRFNELRRAIPVVTQTAEPTQTPDKGKNKPND